MLILVLILLVVGGLILGPLLGLMGTGLVAGQVYEKRATALYACDAGIEDAIWQLLYSADGLPDQPYHLEQVNEMGVTIEKIGEDPIADGAILYTIKSTATRDGKTIGEVIAEVKWQPMPMVEGSSPGTWLVPPPYVDVLTTLDWHTIAFGMQLGEGKTSKFEAAGDDEPIDFGKNDLLGLNLTTCHAWLWVNADDYGIGQGLTIGGAHRYVDDEDGYEYLLMSFKGGCSVTVGTNGLQCNQNRDIVKMYVDPADPDRGEAGLFLEGMRQYFNKNIEIEALGRLDHGDGRLPDKTGRILFSIDEQSDLESPFSGAFDKNEVIILDLGDPSDPAYPDPTSFALYLDVWTHILGLIEGNPSQYSQRPAIVSLSPLPPWTRGDEQHPDGRLLLAFDREVIGSDGRTIQIGDIAIWTPEGWSCGEKDGEWQITDYGEPYSLDHRGEITLHIDMHDAGYFEQIFVALSIVSWNVEG